MNQSIRSIINRIIETGFINVFSSTAFMKIASFAYSIIIVRIISKADYGVYTYANNIYNLFMLFSGFGMALSVLQICSEQSNNKEKSQRTYNYCCSVALHFNVILSLSIASFSCVFDFSIEGSSRLLLLMSLLPIPSIIFNLQQNKLRTDLKNKEYANLNMLASGLLYLLSTLGAIIYGLEGIIYGHLLSYLIPVFISWRKYGNRITFRRIRLSKDEKKPILSVASISMLNSGMTQLMLILSTFILGQLIRDENVIAQYRVASMIPCALVFIPSSVMVWAYPYFAKRKGENRWIYDIYKKLTLICGSVNLVITFICIVFSDLIIKIVFGSQYVECSDAFQIMMLYFCVTGTFGQISGNILMTQRKLIANFVIGIIGIVVSIVMNFIFIPSMNENGAALSQLISACVMGLLSAIVLIKNIISVR